jgi:hypothetical protein
MLLALCNRTVFSVGRSVAQIALAFARDERIVDLAALAVAMLLVLALGTLEAFGLAAGGSTAFSLETPLPKMGHFSA